MTIDRLDKVIGSNYETNKTKSTAQESTKIAPKDRVDISKEASHAAEIAYISSIAHASGGSEVSEKLQKIREKLANNEYNQLSKTQLETIAASIMHKFFS